MPSGKKEAATRTPPPVRSKGAGGLGGTRQASPRALAIAGGVVAIVVVAIVLAVVLGKSNGNGGGSGSGSNDGLTIGAVSGTPAVGDSQTSPLQGAASVATLFKGIPESHFVLGKPNAPVILTEFIDLQCPYCEIFETQDLPTLLQKYVRTGKLQVKLEPWEILDRPGTTTTDSARGQKATIAAAAQNKAFQFSELLYYNQGTEDSNWMTDKVIAQVAAGVDGLKPAQLVSDANSAATKTLVNEVDALATSLNKAYPAFNGTPGIFLSKVNGTPRLFGTGPPDMNALEQAIDALLK
jgi:protein-disulfide isomerase